ncbi:MAG: potassium-transporting ATPase subunit KdpC [Spirochaetota bacterium]
MKQFKISFLIFLIMSVLLGVIYPLVMTGIAEIALSKKANGSLIKINNVVSGSELIGQNFSGQRYFHGRPSANNYDGVNSGGSNFGPTNKKLIDQAVNYADRIRKENGLASDAKIPSDLTLASGSGLDPHIRLDSAMLQAPRIARERKINESVINDLIKKNRERRYFGLSGDSFVNVLKLNIALDSM